MIWEGGKVPQKSTRGKRPAQETQETRPSPGPALLLHQESAAKGLAEEPARDRGLHHLCKGKLGGLTRNEAQEEAGTEITSWRSSKQSR